MSVLLKREEKRAVSGTPTSLYFSLACLIVDNWFFWGGCFFVCFVFENVASCLSFKRQEFIRGRERLCLVSDSTFVVKGVGVNWEGVVVTPAFTNILIPFSLSIIPNFDIALFVFSQSGKGGCLHIMYIHDGTLYLSFVTFSAPFDKKTNDIKNSGTGSNLMLLENFNRGPLFEENS